MKEDFDYQAVPSNYIHCFNPDCAHSKSCLRHLVGVHVQKTIPYIVTVSPAAYPKNAAQCPHFRSTEKIRLAWGISAIYDSIPYKVAVPLKACIRALYPKTSYYRILHEEHPLSPTEQKTIARIFAQHGIEKAPTYDRYTEEYDFKDMENAERAPYISTSISIKK